MFHSACNFADWERVTALIALLTAFLKGSGVIGERAGDSEGIDESLTAAGLDGTGNQA